MLKHSHHYCLLSYFSFTPYFKSSKPNTKTILSKQLKKMALTPEPLLRDNTSIDFRAPPPSPVASGRRSSVRNEEILSDFLQNSLQVPDLILPDRAFPRQISIENPPKIDMGSLNSLEIEVIKNLIECIAQTGCFEVINHGVPDDLIKEVLDGADGIFGIPSEKRKRLIRSIERPFGFEEFTGEDEIETSEEFVWCKDERLKMDMEGIWPLGHSKFSDKMERLVIAMEDVGAKVVLFLKQNFNTACNEYEAANYGELGSLCYLYKHYRIISADKKLNSLRYDAIKMLIGGYMSPHALSLHPCNGSDGFNIYSKKGWTSFRPIKGSILICIGDTLQVRSGGKLKHVIGRPVFQSYDQDCTSLAFMYSPKNNIFNFCYNENVVTNEISLFQQIIIVIILSLLYHLMAIVYNFL